MADEVRAGDAGGKNRKLSEAQKRLCANSDYRKRQGGAISRGLAKTRGLDPAREARLRLDAANRMRHRWADSDYQKRISENTSQNWKDPEVSKRRSEGIRRS